MKLKLFSSYCSCPVFVMNMQKKGSNVPSPWSSDGSSNSIMYSISASSCGMSHWAITYVNMGRKSSAPYILPAIVTTKIEIMKWNQIMQKYHTNASRSCTWVALHYGVDKLAHTEKQRHFLLWRVHLAHVVELVANLLYGHSVRRQSSIHTHLLGLLGFGQNQILLELLPSPTADLEVPQSGLYHRLQRLQHTLVHGFLHHLIYGGKRRYLIIV